MKFPKKEIKKWIDALNSGDYKQSKASLYNGFGYCCLGVACKLQGASDEILVGKAFPYDVYEMPKWLKNINEDVFSKFGGGLPSLSYFNDIKEYSFHDIANLIQLIYIEEAL